MIITQPIMKRRLLSLFAHSLPQTTTRPCHRCLAQQASRFSTVQRLRVAQPANPDSTPLSRTNENADDRTDESIVEDSRTRVGSMPEVSEARNETLAIDAEHNKNYRAEREATIRRLLMREHGTSPEDSERSRLVSFLMSDLPHDIPSQYLMYVNPECLTRKEQSQRQHLITWALTGHVNKDGVLKESHARDIKGVVVSAGKMDRTVKVRVPKQVWQPRIKKVRCQRLNSSLWTLILVVLFLVHEPPCSRPE